VLQCVAVRCSVLQCVAHIYCPHAQKVLSLLRVAVCCSILQCVAVQCIACCSALQIVAVRCSVLQCVNLFSMCLCVAATPRSLFDRITSVATGRSDTLFPQKETSLSAERDVYNFVEDVFGLAQVKKDWFAKYLFLTHRGLTYRSCSVLRCVCSFFFFCCSVLQRIEVLHTQTSLTHRGLMHTDLFRHIEMSLTHRSLTHTDV